jgi:hypothetical protein
MCYCCMATPGGCRKPHLENKLLFLHSSGGYTSPSMQTVTYSICALASKLLVISGCCQGLHLGNLLKPP